MSRGFECIDLGTRTPDTALKNATRNMRSKFLLLIFHGRGLLDDVTMILDVAKRRHIIAGFGQGRPAEAARDRQGALLQPAGRGEDQGGGRRLSEF